MEAERWERVQEIYLDALEMEAEDRAAFLAAVCADDDALRREVESLLGAHEHAETFLQTPAVVVAAEEAKRSTPPPVSPLGRRISHYQILTALGAGGMGEVYLAHDKQLGRKVALKLLPHEFTRDRERIQRFKHEARTVSSLNHPNIVTVFEIGQSEELYYIATEFIDGQTLRQQMGENSLKLSDALDVAIQTTQALTAAHEAGIVHRDIKPENIMRRPDGFVKVLDFGLAKLTDTFRPDAPSLTGGNSSTAGQVSTDPGKVVGTPRYMSPEQIRGEKVDARSDIFSLGVMLYEMIAGRPPFEGATASEVIAGILHVEPMPMARFAPAVPPELDRIVRKTLRKDRDARYQVVKDLQNDLKSFKEDLEFEAKLARSHRTEMPTQTMSTISAAPVGVATVAQPVAPVSAGTSVRTVSSAEYIVNALTRNRRAAVLALTGLVVLGVGLPLAWFQWWGVRQPFQNPNPGKLTSHGKVGHAAISPDGNEVVYSVVDSGQQSLYLQVIGVAPDKTIVSPEKVRYTSVTFSHDGKSIFYVREGTLWKASKLGGGPQQLSSRVDSPITFSPPEMKQLAFVRRTTGESQLIIANDDGTGEKVLATRKHPDMFRYSGPAWSPDGKIIACPVESENASFKTVIAVRVADRQEVAFTKTKWEDVGQVAWLPDGKGMLVTAREPQKGLTQIWHLAWPSGKAGQVTAKEKENAYNSLSLTKNGETLVTIQRHYLVYLYVAPAGDVSETSVRKITNGIQRNDGERGLNWTSDGRIVYRSLADGAYNIYIISADGTDSTGGRQLTKPADQNLDPMVAPDDTYLAWTTSFNSQRNIWRMDLNGSDRRQLTNGRGEWFPQITKDGWLIYQAMADADERLIWKQRLDSGEAIQLTENSASAPVLSPDEKWIACNYRRERAATPCIAVISVNGGPPLKIFDKLTGDRFRILRWTPNGEAVAFIVTEKGVSNIWAQPLAGGEPKQLTHFKTEEIFNFAWSRDGKQLALSRGAVNNDVVKISDQK